MKVLVLGHKGMLGHMVRTYLKKSYTIQTVLYRWPEDNFKAVILNSDADFLINCIGAIPQKTDQFDINTELPIWLENNFSSKIIHPGTDCEMDDDPYGVSKELASNYLKINGIKTKIFKTSIIGPELNNHSSLLDWFLFNEDSTVYGYEDAMWNGVTTLTWAKECRKLIENWDKYKKETILESTCLSKYKLLSLFKEVFSKDIDIRPIPNRGTDKCLKGGIKTDPIKKQLIELKSWIQQNKTLY